jgi:hypothetical protein
MKSWATVSPCVDYFLTLFSHRTRDPVDDTKAASVPNSPKPLSDEACEAAKAAATSLRQLIHKKSGELTSKMDSIIILYFDESHELYGIKTLDTDSPSNYYQALLTAIDVLRSSNIVALFLSTHSHLGGFAPPIRYVLSGRAQPEALQRPFTWLLFDCHPDFPLDGDKLILKDLSTPKFMCKFGRPL